MKLLFAASFLVPFILASDTNPTGGITRKRAFGSDQPLECASPSRKVPKQTPNHSPFDDLPQELVLKILKQVPPHDAPVCRAWEQLIRTFRATAKLGLLFADIAEFEGSFESGEDRDKELTRRIIADYSEIIKQDDESQRTCTESESSDLFTRIQGEPRMNQLIEMLPTLSSANAMFRLRQMLSSNGPFSTLPLPVKQLIARNMWTAQGCTNPKIGSLYSFLTLYHEYIESFRNALVHVDPEVVAEACFKILWHIDSAWLCMPQRKQLLASIGPLYSPDSLPDMICSLRNVLSSESMSTILKAMTSMDVRLVTILTKVLQSFPKYVTANWCLTKLGRSPFPLILDNSNPHYHLLFRDHFRVKHGISNDDQSLLLESCTPEDLLKSVSWTYLYDPAIPALVKWVSGKCDIGTLAFPAAVALYYSDDSPNTLLKYFPSSPQSVDLLAFATIALSLDHKWYLKPVKRDALLMHLSPERASTFDANDKDHRKALLANVMSSLKGPLSDAFVCSLFKPDFLLCTEAWLDDPEACQLPAQLDDRQKNWAAQRLVTYIDKDVNKVANLQKLPEYCQVMVFLLTKYEEVAMHLSNSLDKAQVMLHFVDHWRRSGFNGHEEARRAARRARALCKPLLTELGIE